MTSSPPAVPQNTAADSAIYWCKLWEKWFTFLRAVHFKYASAFSGDMHARLGFLLHRKWMFLQSRSNLSNTRPWIFWLPTFTRASWPDFTPASIFLHHILTTLQRFCFFFAFFYSVLWETNGKGSVQQTKKWVDVFKWKDDDDFDDSDDTPTDPEGL